MTVYILDGLKQTWAMRHPAAAFYNFVQVMSDGGFMDSGPALPRICTLIFQNILLSKTKQRRHIYLYIYKNEQTFGPIYHKRCIKIDLKIMLIFF